MSGETMSEPHPILAALRSPDVQARRVALTRAEDHLDVIPAAALLERLKDEDAVVRRLAIAALEELGAPEAIPGLLDAVGDADEDVRETARIALREFRAAPAVPYLIAGASHPLPAARETALLSLRDHRAPEAESALVAAAADPEAAVRREAVVALGYLGRETSVGAVLKRFKDEDAGVRRAAVGAAVAFVPETAPAYLFAGAQQDADWQVRREAVIALSHFNAQDAENKVIRSLGDPAWQVVKEAALAAGKLKLPRAAELLPLLSRPEPDLRKVAAWSLGEIGDRETGSTHGDGAGNGGDASGVSVLHALEALAADPDGDVRKTASRSAERLRGNPAAAPAASAPPHAQVKNRAHT
jgi:HEAT repeat protein